MGAETLVAKRGIVEGTYSRIAGDTGIRRHEYLRALKPLAEAVFDGLRAALSCAVPDLHVWSGALKIQVAPRFLYSPPRQKSPKNF